jgi:erythromycin esterase
LAARLQNLNKTKLIMKVNILLIAILIIPFYVFGQKTNSKLIGQLNKNIVSIDSSSSISHKISEEIFKHSIIGLGEGTHGTSDFFKIKIQLIKDGIENRGLKLIMIEESLGNTFLLNDYVLNGAGSAKNALSFFGAWIYKVDEVLALVEYIRSYNIGKTNIEKVKFLGFDVQSIKGSLTTLQTLEISQSNVKQAIDELINMDKSFKLYNFWNDTTTNKVNEIIKYLENNKITIDSIQIELVKLNLVSSKKLWTCGDWKTFYTLRDSLMYETLIAAKNIFASEKVVAWGHNGHIMKYYSNTNELKYKSLGYLLSKNFDYYGIGFDFNKGSFKAYGVQEKKHIDFTVNEADAGSTASVFSKLKFSTFFLSLDKSMKNKTIKSFLLTQPFYRQVQATYDINNDLETGYTAREEKANLWEYFNGWIYVNETKASTFFKK